MDGDRTLVEGTTEDFCEQGMGENPNDGIARRNRVVIFSHTASEIKIEENRRGGQKAYKIKKNQQQWQPPY